MGLGKVAACLALGMVLNWGAMLAASAPAGAADGGADLKALSQRVDALYRTGKYARAVPLARDYARRVAARFGKTHTAYATALNSLSLLLKATNRLAEAEPLMRRALAIDEKSYGPNHPDVATDLAILASLLKATNRLAEAEPLYRRALAILDRFERATGRRHPNYAAALNNLAFFLQATNRLAEAEPLFRRALAISDRFERATGRRHPNYAAVLSNLAQLLQDTNRLAEAEPLMRRALAIDEKSYGPNHPNVATALNNLALLLKATNRLAEAEPLMRRALAIDEKSYGPNHPNVARDLNNLAFLLYATNRLAEAEPLFRRALAIDEKSLGPNHPTVARGLNNLAGLLQATNRLAEAEPLYRRALTINEKSLGPNHPTVATALNNLGWLLAVRRRWPAALAAHRRANAIWIRQAKRRQAVRGGSARQALKERTNAFRAQVQAAWYAGAGGAGGAGGRKEGWRMAQWALRTKAAEALAQMAARFAKGGGALAGIVKAQQDLVRARGAADKRLLGRIGKGDFKGAARMRAEIAALDRRLDAIDTRLAHDFPDYAAIANPQPLSIAEAQELLGRDEALVAILDVRTIGIPGETFVWVVTRHEARWRRVGLDSAALGRGVAALRCGLDTSAWIGDKALACNRLLGVGYTGADMRAGKMPPFPTVHAHGLYNVLLAPFADMIRGKRLLMVPSGPLTQLPFHVLLTAPLPDAQVAGKARIAADAAMVNAAWLIRDHAIAVLPSVASLKLLRRHADRAHAPKPFIGFGNPLLLGSSGNDSHAFDRQSCPPPAKKPSLGERIVVAMKSLPGFFSLFRGALADVEKVRHLEPLPGTTDELCAVARSVGVAEADIPLRVVLGARASETAVKRLSAEGQLARYRVVHFATHGLIADEARKFLGVTRAAEPGLVLTPPAEASEVNDGILAASEIAQLHLNADWVVLSACNTAAGGARSAESLSGLASAFVYAGARSLLVSHWSVWSNAAVQLTTRAFAAVRRNPRLTRPEALRRAILSVISDGRSNPRKAHPNYWAPFVLVGN